MLAALIPAVGGEVEHVPHMGGPQPGPGLNHVQHVLMVDALVALGIVPLLRAPGLVLGVGVRAVLREADDLIRVRGVEAVEELVVLLQLA